MREESEGKGEREREEKEKRSYRILKAEKDRRTKEVELRIAKRIFTDNQIETDIFKEFLDDIILNRFVTGRCDAA